MRNSINDVRLTSEQITEIVKRFNVPVAAGAVKLWLLELNPPVMGWEGWEDAKGIYPASKSTDVGQGEDTDTLQSVRTLSEM